MINLNEEAQVGDHVIASIKDLKARIDKKPINFNTLLPTDINSDVYDLSKAKEFDAAETKIAETALGTRDRNNSTGILGIAAKIASENAKGKALKQLNCGKAVDIINGTMNKGLKESDDRDVFAIAASCVIIANALAKEGKDLDVDYSDKQGEGKSKEEFSDKQGGEKSEEKPNTQVDSYQLPKVSKDSLINEIYSYIMSTK